ncbi:hypothetical protein [Archaeoglobus neptunius]|uniref:hypothetical protein n=1 Tax=Archaeoglobus neptunius TaxID=2798580 RepID=UPI001925BE28|nr:hypothetical protein [Archaeoglobus neptunius]
MDRRFLLFVLFGTLATSTMMNAPAIFVGYGLVYLVMLLASWLFNPKKAFFAVLLSTLLSLPILLMTKAVFVEVAVLNVIVRAPIAYVASYVRWRNGLLSSTFTLSALETFTALLIAILYFGDDGIHASLSIFGILLAPFGYVVYMAIENGEKLKATAGLFAAFLFYLSLVTFPVLVTVFSSLLAVPLLTRRSRSLLALTLVLLFASSAYALTADDGFKNNLKISLYPFNPKSWSEERWKQESGLCPEMSDVFVNTHTPERLRIIGSCIEITGIVKKPPFVAGDGDYCFDIIPDNKNALGIGNYVLRRGALHVEVVPRDQIEVLTPVQGVCPGDLVKVRGVWVVDTDHGMWTEVHPAFKIEILKSGADRRWPECVIGKEFEE